MDDQQPGTVRVTLTGAAPDLVRAFLFLERVSSGSNPDVVLRALRLVAIRITEEAGRGRRLTFTLELLEAAP